MEKKNKKKSIILALLLFALVGLAGYGAYSYYWAEGDFFDDGDYHDDNSPNIIHMNGTFDPETTEYSDGSNKNFLGQNGSFELTCGAVDENFNTRCTGNLYIYNDGNTSIDVEVTDSVVEGDYLDIDETTPSFNWTSTTISAGSNRTLTATADVHIKGASVDDSEAEEVSAPVEQEEGNVIVRYNLKATQAH